MKYAIGFYLIMTVVALFLYARDKRKAKKHKWRTPESVLLGVGFFGGAIGGLLGMNLFHHKTKHWYFWAVNIISLLLHASIFWYFFLK